MRQKIDEIDQTLAKNLKIARTDRGVSQAWVGESLGVTFQQIQKYEKAKNRISASSLYKLALDLYPDADIGDTILWMYGIKESK